MSAAYQKELDGLISSLSEQNNKPKLLLHSCCGPCSSYVLEYLSQFFDITVYYYNPSIYPEEEYLKRLDNQDRLLALTGWADRMETEYDHSEYLEAVKGYEDAPEGGMRCEICFRQRIYKTAETAKVYGFDFFATTLTVSPHKNAELINRISEEAERIYGIAHLPSDFKKKNGYKRSIELSREYDLYRQDYCGCEFSIRNRDKGENV